MTEASEGAEFQRLPDSLKYLSFVDKILGEFDSRGPTDVVRIELFEAGSSKEERVDPAAQIMRVMDTNHGITSTEDILSFPGKKEDHREIKVHSKYDSEGKLQNCEELKLASHKGFLKEFVGKVGALVRSDGSVVRIDGKDALVSDGSSWTKIAKAKN